MNRTSRAALTLAGLLCAGGALQAASLSVTVLDRDGKPAPDAVVIVTPASAATRPLAPIQTSIAQSKMQFVPALTVVPVGSRVGFSNEDGWEHHVRGSAAGLAQFAAGNAGGFELRLEARAEGRAPRVQEVTLAKAGPVLLGCHIHGSMRGHIYVTDSPWALKTGADGVAEFTDLPEGAAQLRVWHADQLLDLPATATTLGSAPGRATVRLQVVPRRRRL